MVNVIRRSQIIGLMAMDSSTATQYGYIEEVWLDETGKVVYLGASEGYTPLEQISVVGADAVLTKSEEAPSFHGGVSLTYDSGLPRPLENLLHLNRMEVRYSDSDPLGWVEDFLFDWSTGDIAAYVLGGDIAEPFGGRAVLFPDDVKVIDTEAIIIKEEATNRLQSEKEGLQGFISEKSQQVKHLVQKMVNLLRDSVHPQDEPEVVHIKIEEVSDELAYSGRHDRNTFKEATEFLQDKWSGVQRSISRYGTRMQSALDSSWKQLIHK